MQRNDPVIQRVDDEVDALVNRLAHTLSRHGIKYETTYKIDGHAVKITIETVDEEPPEDSVTYISVG